MKENKEHLSLGDLSLKKMAKRNSLNRKEMNFTKKEGTMERAKVKLKFIFFSSYFLKLCLIVEAKIITLPCVVLNVCRENKTIIN